MIDLQTFDPRSVSALLPPLLMGVLLATTLGPIFDNGARLPPASSVGSLSSLSGIPPNESTFDTLRTVSRRVFRRTNETRRERGLPTLEKEPTLAAVACAHNADMFRRNFIRHETPDGDGPQDRVAQMHRRFIGGVSENLYGQRRVLPALDTLAAFMVEKWVNSPLHRKNLLDPRATHLGVCILRRNDTLRATQLFANAAAYLADPLPRRIERGTTLPLSFDRTVPADATIAQYDFWNPRTRKRVSARTIPPDSLHVPDTTGTLRTRFYMLHDGKSIIYHGPDVTITSPS